MLDPPTLLGGPWKWTCKTFCYHSGYIDESQAGKFLKVSVKIIQNFPKFFETELKFPQIFPKDSPIKPKFLENFQNFSEIS